jgi:4-hydroxy-3-polyprenylbenzoate decarboxylase
LPNAYQWIEIGKVMELIVAITGASGAIYAVRLLEVLKLTNVATHLVISGVGESVIANELGWKKEKVVALATSSYQVTDLQASIASGSYRTDGMVIVPCSMKTLAGIAHGYAENLIQRAADVTLKERRPLVLVPREMPFNTIHIENMLRVARSGAIIVPAMPAFYHQPKTIDDLVNHVIGKVLDIFNVNHELYRRWRTA